MEHPPRESRAAVLRARLFALAPFLLAALAIALALGWIATSVYSANRDDEAAELEGIAAVRATHATVWLQERISLARYGEGRLALLYREWQATRDPQVATRIRFRLGGLAAASSGTQAFLVDPEGAVLLRADDESVDPRLHSGLTEAARRAQSTHELHLVTEFSADTLNWIELVAPLDPKRLAQGPSVVLRLNPYSFLGPTLLPNPLPEPSGGTYLVRRDGTVLLGTQHRGALPPAAEWGRLLDGAVKTRDGNGTEVLAVARPVSGTDWLVIARVDWSEAMGQARQELYWIAGLALAACILCVAGGLYLRQRQELQLRRVRDQQDAEQLRSLAMLQAVTDGTPDIVTAKDLDGRYVLFNRAASAFTGLAREQVLGRRAADVFDAERAARLEATDRKVIGTGKTLRNEFDSRSGPNGPQTFSTTWGPMHDAAGRMMGVFSIWHDITSRRRTELDLRRSEAIHRSMVTALVEGVMIFNRRGELLAANPAAERILGGAAAWARERRRRQIGRAHV